MDMQTNHAKIVDWLAEMLKANGHGAQQKLAIHLNLSPSAITRMLNTDPRRATRGISAEEMVKIANFFGVQPPVFPDSQSNPSSTTSLRSGSALRELNVDTIPISGIVEAGAFRAVDEEYDEETAKFIVAERSPKYAHLAHRAYESRGDSMNLAGIEDGDTVICVDWADGGFVPTNGMKVVVERRLAGGLVRELTVKEIKIVAGGINLMPRSSNKAHKPIFVPREHADDGTEIQIMGKVTQVVKHFD